MGEFETVSQKCHLCWYIQTTYWRSIPLHKRTNIPLSCHTSKKPFTVGPHTRLEITAQENSEFAKMTTRSNVKTLCPTSLAIADYIGNKTMHCYGKMMPRRVPLPPLKIYSANLHIPKSPVFSSSKSSSPIFITGPPPKVHSPNLPSAMAVMHCPYLKDISGTWWLGTRQMSADGICKTILS